MLPVRMVRLSLPSLLAGFLAACSSGGDDDEVSFADAAETPADAAAAVCTDFAATDLGALDPLPNAQAFQAVQQDPPAGNADAKVVQLLGAAAGGENPDILVLELWDGYGAFEGGDVVTGEWTIEGPETAVLTCGVCVYLWSDVTITDGMIVASEKDYIATAGTVTAESVMTNFTGTASGLSFTEIDTTSEMGTPLAGGCQTAASSVTFDAAITIPTPP